MDSNEKNPMSRRQVVGGAGFALAASTAPALAQGATAMPAALNQADSPAAADPLQNPVTKYPKPP